MAGNTTTKNDNLNTSNVDIKPAKLSIFKVSGNYLNTSNVDIKLIMFDRNNPIFYNLNTSNVDIKQRYKHTSLPVN